MIHIQKNKEVLQINNKMTSNFLQMSKKLWMNTAENEILGPQSI